MAKRHMARQAALQILYAMDIKGVSHSFEYDIHSYIKNLADREIEVDDDLVKFTQELISGINDNNHKIKKIIENYLKNWKFERLSIIDKNILSIAIYEMLFRDDIPSKVSINEAIELAKEFSGEGAPGFINGILDSIKRDMERGIDFLA